MTIKETSPLIETLKKEAATNKAANAVFHVFALRQRARRNVTVHSLEQRMKKEGFDFSPNEYSGVLKTLAGLGFGKLQTDHKGRVKALTDVNTTLQSIGSAACGQRVTLTGLKSRNKFTTMVVTKMDAAPTAEIFKKVAPVPQVDLRLSLAINGKPVSISVPENLTAEEITGIILKLQSREF